MTYGTSNVTFYANLVCASISTQSRICIMEKIECTFNKGMYRL